MVSLNEFLINQSIKDKYILNDHEQLYSPNNTIFYTTKDNNRLNIDPSKIEYNRYNKRINMFEVKFKDKYDEFDGDCLFGDSGGIYSITNIIFPKHIEYFKNNCFFDCINLESIMAVGLKDIGKKAFYNCFNLVSLNDPNKKVINYPNGYNEIPYSCFEECTSIVEVNIPASVYEIKGFSFIGCKNLKKINLDNIVSIGASAFYNCESLNEIHLSNTIHDIGNFAFDDCTSLDKNDIDKIRKINKLAYVL